MSFACVLIPFNLESQNQNLLGFAHEFATRFDAWQIGVAAASISLPYFAEGPVAADVLKQVQAGLAKRFMAIERAFQDMNAERLNRIAFRSAERLPDEFVVAAVRDADLVIVERTSEPFNLAQGPDIGNLLMRAGRPLLVVSKETASFAADKVVVAWKETREARRAVLDALPILQLATKVEVLEILESPEERRQVRCGADDVVVWLARHGIQATSHVSRDAGNAAALIEDHALRMGADLIVAGGFGRSRFLEWLFGGVTRHLLWHSRFPVLLSH
jgi:nucleotide-binding universal stress UspA family protein